MRLKNRWVYGPGKWGRQWAAGWSSKPWFPRKSLRPQLLCFKCVSTCHPAYLTYMRAHQWETLGWRKQAQAGIKIAERNINNLRYAEDTTLLAEGEELKSLLMKEKEESEKGGLKLNIQKTKIMASSPITSWQIDGETVETGADFYFGGHQNHCRWWLQPWN